jgi:gamma-glutamyltranspeptidase
MHRLFLDKADVARAVAAPRVHDQLLPKSNSMYEDYKWGYTAHELPPVLVDDLKQRGQNPTGESFALGISQAITLVWPEPEPAVSLERGALPSRRSASVPQRPVMYGMGDPRKDGAAMGV